ncbi:hypothetical protein [Candidatus Magnetominusculus xianensis]|nr:hypothetical protein [Candidatus Magnetominusculus xianensis]
MEQGKAFIDNIHRSVESNYGDFLCQLVCQPNTAQSGLEIL